MFIYETAVNIYYRRFPISILITLKVLIFAHHENIYFARINFRAQPVFIHFARINFRASKDFQSQFFLGK